VLLKKPLGAGGNKSDWGVLLFLEERGMQKNFCRERGITQKGTHAERAAFLYQIGKREF